MIIFTDNTGQLGNQLFEFSSFISNSLRHNTPLVNLFFENYRRFFEGSSTNSSTIKVTTNSLLLDKVSRKWIQRISANSENLLKGTDIPYDLSKFDSKGKIVYKKGAWFTNFDDFYHYENEIKSYFKPVKIHRTNIEALITSCRNKASILVGIHVRGGDYKNFLNGQFYFETGIYYDKMLQIAALFPNQKVGFLICSNDPIETDKFEGITTFKGTNHFIEDMYSLAECDYILGPPSTYTMWASFYGKTPLLKLRTKEQKIDLKDFVMDYGY